ncbi:MAG: thioredoxin-dependent thiol peroxidase [Campylobacter sp.]|nr:thioredoxin-dependent thiol peroxidase [Campylobacter sp.]MBQ6224398.1 thioredoxin-dependent thiol peroxidase [Campylobacter sp.]MBQ7270276.1 thioredoxin-dependent thiol peroxidase [Campylobacter sp.]MBQ7676488.1 thioredoxin-dependent thiol peroxidase [Campylobacter sp.]MBQ9877130.1 thioredoxin-dependent thiol peroxidase [Campylobacter sp.]
MACCRKKADGERKSEICESEFSKEDLERKVVLTIGDTAPEFSLQNSDGVSVNLKDFIGKKVVLYFYPKDNTPGCTTEACEFSALYDDFIANDTVIIGISPDSVKSHTNFIAKQNLKHILLSDENKEVSKAYGVYQVRKNYGREYLGIVRTTFVIDEKGKIAKVYKSVKAKDHAAKVLADLAK